MYPEPFKRLTKEGADGTHGAQAMVRREFLSQTMGDRKSVV